MHYWVCDDCKRNDAEDIVYVIRQHGSNIGEWTFFHYRSSVFAHLCLRQVFGKLDIVEDCLLLIDHPRVCAHKRAAHQYWGD
jgi:hypothetical protein